jgi:hypothetical protein
MHRLFPSSVIPAFGAAVLAVIGAGDQTLRDPRPASALFSCLTPSPSPESFQATAARLTAWQSRQPEKFEATTITAYFHVIRNTKTCPHETVDTGCMAAGDPGNTLIFEQMKVLNAAFADAGVTFSLRAEDIDRRANAKWLAMTKGSPDEGAAGSTMRKGDVRALNIYSAYPGGFGSAAQIVGWGGYPPEPGQIGFDLARDHVVIPFDRLPNAGGYANVLGYILVHEVAHWFGVFHTFEHGCDAPGDLVKETTPEKDAARGCPHNQQSCRLGNDDPITNLMDYTDDDCKILEFEPTQIGIIQTGWKLRLAWP